jgi:poly(3-hydroxybutyrate) depolymerase
MSMVDHACRRYAVLADRVCAFGLSAGGAMAMMLGLRYPDRFAAVGSHSGAAPFSASNASQASRAMRGERAPDIDAARLLLAGRRPPPLLLMHGDEDAVVSYDNATATAAMWLDLVPHGVPHLLRCRQSACAAARAGRWTCSTGRAGRARTCGW